MWLHGRCLCISAVPKEYTRIRPAVLVGRHSEGMTFPNGTTKSDRFVAFNAAYADFCKSFSDEDVLRIAYDFYFADEDWKGSGKIWTYMSMNV